MVQRIDHDYSPEKGLLTLYTTTGGTTVEVFPAKTAVRNLAIQTRAFQGLSIVSLAAMVGMAGLAIGSIYDSVAHAHILGDTLGSFGQTMDVNPNFSASLSIYGALLSTGLVAGFADEAKKSDLKLAVARTVLPPTPRRQIGKK